MFTVNTFKIDDMYIISYTFHAFDLEFLFLLFCLQDGIYQVLLSLSTSIWQEHRPHEALRTVHMYGLFVRMVLRELDQGLNGGWAAVIRVIVTRLLLLLEERFVNKILRMQ